MLNKQLRITFISHLRHTLQGEKMQTDKPQSESQNESSTLDTLREELKNLIITSLNLPDMKSSDIADDMPLFGTDDNGLGLDSVDALELGLAIQKQYGLKLDSKQGNLKEIFYSVSTLSKYIATQAKS